VSTVVLPAKECGCRSDETDARDEERESLKLVGRAYGYPREHVNCKETMKL